LTKSLILSQNFQKDSSEQGYNKAFKPKNRLFHRGNDGK